MPGRRTFTALLLLISAVICAEPEIEVLHWWYEGGDRRAVQVLVDHFEARGGIWYDDSAEDYQSTRQSALTRMTRGYPPGLIQWNSGTEVEQFAQLGLVKTEKNTAIVQQYREVYNASVFDAIFFDDEVVALPINVHGENWVWINADLNDIPGRNTLETTESFFESLDLLSNNVEAALAISAEGWQLRVFFHSLLLSELGSEGLAQYLGAQQSDIVYSAAFTGALEYFLLARKYSRSFGNGHWREQVAAVADGRAYAVFMGDWAKGELLALDKVPGQDVLCHLAPGTADHYIPVFDVFLQGNIESAVEQNGQEIMRAMLLDPEVVYPFNAAKGSVPPFKEIDRQRVDSCGLKAVELLNRKGAVLPALAMFSDGQFHGSLQLVLAEIWQKQAVTVSDAQQAIKEVLEQEQQRQSMLQALHTE